VKWRGGDGGDDVHVPHGPTSFSTRAERSLSLKLSFPFLSCFFLSFICDKKTASPFLEGLGFIILKDDC